MKNLNKVLAMVVVFVMMLSTVAFASSFTDVADTSSYSTAIEVGVDLGIIKGYTDGTFAPEGEITRAEFAAIIVRLLGQEAQAEGAKATTQFIDVPAEHWAAGYINIAVQAKVINGYGDGNFGPDDLVEYQDAITMMVRALGYEPAIGSAGYPTGYLTKAGELGLTTNVNGVNGVAINRGTVAQIAFNSLDVALMTQSGYGTFTQYVINDGYSSTMGTTNVKKTLLSENHKTVKIQGIIEDSTDSTSSATTGVDKVTVDVTNYMYNKFGVGVNAKGDLIDEVMLVGSSDAMKFVGKKCIIFVEYDEFEDECTVKSLYEVKSSDTLVLDLADIEKYTSPVADVLDGNGNITTKGSNGKIEYAVSGSKTTDVSIDRNAIIYYNGVLLSEVTSTLPTNNELIQKSGNIELALLGTTTTADYDTVYITAYDVIVVKEVRESANRVVAKTTSDNQLLRINYSEDDGDVRATLLDAEGAEMDWADLEENDVVAVKYVKAGKALYDAHIINNVVTGTIDELDASANWGTLSQTYADYKYVTIDGTEYKVLACAESDKEIKVGDEGTYYLSESGIVWHEASIAVNENYGYVIKAAKATDMDDAQIKLITKENGIVTFDVAAKIYVTDMDINGAGKGYERSTAKISSKNLEGYVATGDLITYKVDASNTVTAIELPLDMSNNQNSIYDAEDYFTYHDSKDLTNFDPDDSTFGNLTLTEDTVVFDVTDGDKDNWEVVAIKNLAEGDALGGAKIYNVDDKDNIGAIVVTDISKTVISGATDAATFVTGSSEAYDEDGVLVTYVKGYCAGEAVTYVSEVGAPAVGSLVIPKYKANGDVKEFKEVKTGYTGGVQNTGNYAIGISGTPSNQDSSKGRIVVNGTTYKVPASANVYVMDKRSSNTNRVKYTLDAYLGYIEYDANDANYAWYIDEDDKKLNVSVTMYQYDGDIVDLVYTIND